MTKPPIPDVGSKGTYTFLEPFKSAINLSPQILYTCRGVRSISDLISSNEDLDTLIYNQLKITDKQVLTILKEADFKADRLIVVLQSEIGAWLYVPIQYISTYPSTNGIPYVYRNLTLVTPPISLNEDISGLMSVLSSKIQSCLGVAPKGRIVTLDTPETVAFMDLQDQMVIRDVAKTDGSDLTLLLDIEHRIAIADSALATIENAVMRGFSASSTVIRLTNPHVLKYVFDKDLNWLTVTLDDFHSTSPNDKHASTTWMLASNGKIVSTGECMLDLQEVWTPMTGLDLFSYDLKVIYTSKLGSVMASDWFKIDLPHPSINAPTITARLNTGESLTISMSSTGCTAYRCTLLSVVYTVISPSGTSTKVTSTEGEAEVTWDVPTSPAPDEGDWVIVANYTTVEGITSAESNIVEVTLVVNTVKPVLSMGMQWTTGHDKTEDMIDCLLSGTPYTSDYEDTLVQTLWEGFDVDGKEVPFTNTSKLTLTNTIPNLLLADIKIATVRLTYITKYGKVVSSDASTIASTHLVADYATTKKISMSYIAVTSNPYSMTFKDFKGIENAATWIVTTDAISQIEFTDGTNTYVLKELSGIWSSKDAVECKTLVDGCKAKGLTMVDTDNLPTWMHPNAPTNTDTGILYNLTATMRYTGPTVLLLGTYVNETIT